MTRASRKIKEVSRHQLDRRIDRIRGVLSALRQPPQGWIASVRTALGMTQAHLASRMGVARQAITQLEQRELHGTVTVKALQDAARALGGEFVYAIVPDHPIHETLERRAKRLARQMVTSVRHSMRLEDQETDSDLEARAREIARELLSSPEKLWSMPNGE